MKAKIIKTIMLALTLIISSCGPSEEATIRATDAQNLSEMLEQKEKERQEDTHAYSDSLPKGMMEKYIALQFKDSGSYVHKLKDGPWLEYRIDSSLDQINVKELPVKKGMKFGCTVVKDEGNYHSGKEEGTWKRFTTLDNRPPFRWDLTYETEFKKGAKDGNEIRYGFYGDTLSVATYKKNKLLNKRTIQE